jgi:hypothetical protein
MSVTHIVGVIADPGENDPVQIRGFQIELHAFLFTLHGIGGQEIRTNSRSSSRLASLSALCGIWAAR